MTPLTEVIIFMLGGAGGALPSASIRLQNSLLQA